MPIQLPQSATIFQSYLLSALQGTGITQTSPGGKARAFCDAVGSQLGGLEGRAYSSIGQSLLPYATSDNLDFLGEIYGIPRLDAQTGNSPASDGNFVFYVKDGTFGSINSGNNIVVPAGTAISTNDPNGPVYTTDFTVTLPASSSSQYVSATSVLDGSAGNVQASVFVNLNFLGYTNARYGSLQVTNNFGVVIGRDAETDDNYRYRISLKLQSTGGAAEADLRLAILQVPGIQDVVFSRQAGTYLAYIYAISPAVPPSLLQMVQSQINDTTAWPLTGTAVSPDLIGISLATPVTFASNINSSEQQTAIDAATAAAQNYIDNLATGQEFVINAAADAILTANSNIVDIGNPDQPILNLYIWRTRDDGTRYSRFLVANYTPTEGERLIVEFSIPTPINLTPAS